MSNALDEFKKPIEEWARALVDGKPMENLLILYKLLYALRLPDRRNRFQDRPAVRSGYQKGKNTLVILMKVTSVRVLTTNEGNLLAYADITIDNCFRVSDLKNFRRPPGYFVLMPQVSGNSRKAT